MPLILGSDLVLYNRCVLEAKLSIAYFEMNNKRDAAGAIQHMGTGTVTATSIAG